MKRPVVHVLLGMILAAANISVIQVGTYNMAGADLLKITPERVKSVLQAIVPHEHADKLQGIIAAGSMGQIASADVDTVVDAGAKALRLASKAPMMPQ